MGCDIHAYLEQVLRDDFAMSVAQFHLGRNYQLFGIMAGVRGPEHMLFRPRGVPNNIGTFAYSDYVVSPHREGCSEESIRDWVARGTSVWIDEERCIASGPDWHSASWLTAAEMEQVRRAYEQMELPQASWYQGRPDVSPNDPLANGARREEISITQDETSRYPGMYYVEVGPRTSPAFPSDWAALLAAMRELGDAARLVFWFDN